MNAEKGFQDAQYQLGELIESFQEGDILEFIVDLLLFPFRYIYYFFY